MAKCNRRSGDEGRRSHPDAVEEDADARGHQDRRVLARCVRARVGYRAAGQRTRLCREHRSAMGALRRQSRASLDRHLHHQLEEPRVHQYLGARQGVRHDARELRGPLVLPHGTRGHRCVDVGGDRTARALRRRADAFATTDAVAVIEMGDRGAIQNLMVQYTEALDDGAFDALGELFEGGSVTIEGGPHSGREASGAQPVADLYRSIVALDPEFGVTGTRHFITNIFIEVDDSGQAAVGRSYFAVTQQTTALPLQLVACGGYHDRFERAGARWQFAARRIVCDQVGDLSQHMRP
ncbi:MAG: nuclear transport factor 2 family protein [Actinobacteria bacterium]|nr:MAG: nuclear transport factor 2 family protein [Actinomycetota bacterium]